MATYKNKEELKGKCFREGDSVIFTVKDTTLKYRVTNNSLIYGDFFENGGIFELLNLNKYHFANRVYGYQSGIGYFPKCVEDDYKALTRIATALFEECEKVNNMRNITLTVSKETLEEMYKSDNETLKKIAIEACPEIATPKLDTFLKHSKISKGTWNNLNTYGKTIRLANYLNQDIYWYDKFPENAYAIYWNFFANKWEIDKVVASYIGTVLFKTYDAATLAADILNECNAE